MLYIVGLGPGDWDYVTPHAINVLKSCARVILRTGRVKCAKELSEAVEFETLDDLYETSEDFDALCSAISERVTKAAQEGDTAYVVSDVAEITVGALMRHINEMGKDAPKVEIVPGVPACGAASAGLSGEYQIADASDWESIHINPRLPLIIREIDTRLLAGEIKVRLMDKYPSDARVRFFSSSVNSAQHSYEIPLEQLDRQAVYDHTVCARIESVSLDELSEKVMSADGDTHFDFEHLVEIVEKLRAPGGCPWDREQTHESLRRSMLEECYEVLECIDTQDWDHLCEELGDVLLQVAMHAQIAREFDEFTMDDVTQSICKKMIFRHSHIFGSDTATDSRDVLKLWEERKKKEKGLKTTSQTMDGVSRSLPALLRADKVQNKARQVGFDWDDPMDALKKVHEEADEVAQALSDNSNIEEELGDLLFACVNAARLSGFDSEQALRMATQKFTDRFTRMERAILDDGKQLSSMTLEEMDKYWDRIKH